MIANCFFYIKLIEKSNILWKYVNKKTGKSYEIDVPVFEIEEKDTYAKLKNIKEIQRKELLNGCIKYTFSGDFISTPGLSLEIVFHIAEDNPVVRFQYRLRSKKDRFLTKAGGKDNLKYTGLDYSNFKEIKEVQFSQFREDIHSYTLNKNTIKQESFTNGKKVMGPMLIAGNENNTLLLAYEHGSQVPDTYINFQLKKSRKVVLTAVKGNYFNTQPIGPGNEYETIWLQFAAVEGDEKYLAESYRSFVLKNMSVNLESRQPYIFYNTWNYQERNKWWNNKTFLDSMTEERILKEIDVAYKIGVDVFVIDTGWYKKTGDWQVNNRRFFKNLKNVKEKLDQYEMKLGLWFDPTAAAISSKILKEHEDCIITRGGEKPTPRPIWETEKSYEMCLVSRYRDAFANELIRLAKEVGVTYFKWDAIGQYGCDDPGHWHGNKNNSREERASCYSFELIKSMNKIVDKVCKACPEAIVDFDITEAGRAVGLGFLSSGKYFLINNGPYYANYDIPISSEQWSNMLVYPGSARTWNCRKPLTYDKWIPSILFLTHYLPDDPFASQLINIASLILGQNGIWGDLLNISSEGVKLFRNTISKYKKVRKDITESYPVREGPISGSPEIHEKISSQTGKGVIVIFATRGGVYHYISHNKVKSNYAIIGDGVKVAFDGNQRAILQINFDRPGAKIIFFGV